MTRSVRHRWPGWPLIAVVLLVVLIVGRWQADPPPTIPTLPESGQRHRVSRVVDGDTLLLESGVRVRLIGIDTPETKHRDRPVEAWGHEAAEFTRRRVEGEWVELQYDRERLDDYQRVLAYVSIEGTLLNEELIRAGLQCRPDELSLSQRHATPVSRGGGGGPRRPPRYLVHTRTCDQLRSSRLSRTDKAPLCSQ